MGPRASDSLASAPSASDIVFAGASEVTRPEISLNNALTASDIVFAGASDVFIPTRNKLENTPTISDIVTASDIVSAGASRVFEPPRSSTSAPTASDIVFAGASKVSGPQNQHENSFNPSGARFYHTEHQSREDEDSEHEPTGEEEDEFLDDQKKIWDYDEIKGLFDLFDTDNDGYLTTNDLNAFAYIWGSHALGRDGNEDLLRRIGPHRRIDFLNFLKFVPLLDIDLDNPIFVREKFAIFVSSRLRGGFVLGSALRKLVIEFHIHLTETKVRESKSEKVYGSIDRLKWIFSALDEDGDGYLTTKGVDTFMRLWEKEPIKCHRIRDEVDTLWSGKIDFENFLELLGPSDTDLIRRTEGLKLVPLLNRIFNLLDEDGDGYISSQEVETFKHIWKTDPNRVENFTGEFDTSGSDCFDFPDFFNLFPLRLKGFYLRNLKEDGWQSDHLKEIFSLLDEDGDGCLSPEEVMSFTQIWSMLPKEAQYIFVRLEDLGDRRFKFSEFLDLLPAFEIDAYLSVALYSSWQPVQHKLITHLNHMFNSLDEDRDGRLTSKEVESFMRVWRLHPVLAERIISEVDSSGRHTIDFPNLLAKLYSNDSLLKERTKDQWPPISNFIEMFSSLDEDGDGCLTSQQVENLILVYMHKKLDLKEIQEFTAELHRNKKGKIDFPSFLNWLYPRNNELTFRDMKSDYIMRVQDAFRLLDQDGDDHLTTKEVQILTRLWKLSPTTTRYILTTMNADWNGTIDLPHFFHLINGRVNTRSLKTIKKYEILIQKFQDAIPWLGWFSNHKRSGDISGNGEIDNVETDGDDTKDSEDTESEDGDESEDDEWRPYKHEEI